MCATHRQELRLPTTLTQNMKQNILCKRNLRRLFVNTGLETLLSIVRKTFRPDRCNLSGKTFEQLMMFRCNVMAKSARND